MKLVVFDVDGTLIDSQGDIVAAMSHTYDTVGLPRPSRKKMLSIVGLSLPNAMAHLEPQAPELHDAMVVAYRSAFVKLRAAGNPAETSPLFPGVRDTLNRLSQHPDVLLAVATGKSRRGMEKLVVTHDLEGMFVTQQVADFHPSKPHPSMLHTCLENTGVAAQDAVMVGDTSYDMQMARAAGIHAIAVSYGYHDAAQLTDADEHINDMPELIARLENRWGVSL